MFSIVKEIVLRISLCATLFSIFSLALAVFSSIQFSMYNRKPQGFALVGSSGLEPLFAYWLMWFAPLSRHIFRKPLGFTVVGSSGLEPPTSRLSGVRSNHLSYEPIGTGGDEENRTPDPPACKAGALPAELHPRAKSHECIKTLKIKQHNNSHAIVYRP